jgi:hypothetical protein
VRSPEPAKKPQAVRQVLPELLRDLGDPFPAVWAHFQTAHSDREAARLFANVLAQIEVEGLAPVAATALTAGTPILLALTTTSAAAVLEAVDVPPALRDIDVPSGCAADYDGWLTEVMA